MLTSPGHPPPPPRQPPPITCKAVLLHAGLQIKIQKLCTLTRQVFATAVHIQPANEAY